MIMISPMQVLVVGHLELALYSFYIRHIRGIYRVKSECLEQLVLLLKIQIGAYADKHNMQIQKLAI